jgi:homoserine dehydrogenase
MSVATVLDVSPQSAVRTLRIGLLGLGKVGQAVARLAADHDATAPAGLRFSIEHALVRDAKKPRACPKPRITASHAAFLHGEYDVVIEALDALEPARALVSQLLARGTSVVTANKSLVAAHGAELAAIAVRSGASFRFEASALSAIPFLGTLAARPLVACVDRVLAIVNGTSNYLLTSLAKPGTSFDTALHRAQQLGFAEPDPGRDLDGLDAADKLQLLATLFGWGRLSRQTLEVKGIRHITADDLAAARSAGGVIKPVVSAQRERSCVRAFVGAAFLPISEPLSSLSGALNGIRLDGRHVSNLFFSGPGAGPDVTAATLLDDAVQAASGDRLHPRAATDAAAIAAEAPVTRWFVRITVPGILPPVTAVSSLVTSCGLYVERVAEYSTKCSRWVLLGPHHRRDVEAALARLEVTHRIQTAAIRRI